jgi:hypothetical protein
MADNESSSSDTDAAVQDQLLNDPSEHKFTAEELMEDCPYTVALKVIDTSL